MKLTYLGSGNAFVPQRDWGCVLVNDAILLDAAPTALVGIKRLRMDPARINHIFISHFHGDHFLGFPFLFLEYKFLTPTHEPLAVIGPPGIEEMMRRTMELSYPDVLEMGWPRPMLFIEAQPGEMQTVNGVTFSGVTVHHVPEYHASIGYRLMLEDGILAYSGDTTLTEDLKELVKDARVLILEASSEDVSHVHLGREALRTLLDWLPDDCLVFLNHLDTPGVEPWHGLPVIVPRDLQTYEIDTAAIAGA